jgi:hypothetical protein
MGGSATSPAPAPAGGSGTHTPAPAAGSALPPGLTVPGIPVNRWELDYREDFEEWLRSEPSRYAPDCGSPGYMIMWAAFSAGREWGSDD